MVAIDVDGRGDHDQGVYWNKLYWYIQPRQEGGFDSRVLIYVVMVMDYTECNNKAARRLNDTK